MMKWSVKQQHLLHISFALPTARFSCRRPPRKTQPGRGARSAAAPDQTLAERWRADTSAKRS